MYKIKLICNDPGYEAPYESEINKEFKRMDEAKIALLECAIDEVESLNEPDVNFTPRTKVFVLSPNCEFEGKKFDAAIVMWDGVAEVKEQFVTGYYIEWENASEIDKYNRKLRDKYGDNITVEICSELGFTEDDDEAEEHEVFFYTSALNGESNRYATLKEVYKKAEDYIENIDIYV